MHRHHIVINLGCARVNYKRIAIDYGA